MRKFSKTFILSISFFLVLPLLLNPSVCLEAGRSALELCLYNVIPSLFPFLVLSGVFVAFGFAGYVGRRLSFVMRPLFGVSGSGAAALILGSVSGYPTGAVCAAALYSDGECTKSEAERLCAFCNNSGPLFIMGVISCGILQTPHVGSLLYASHLISAVLTGLCLKFFTHIENSVAKLSNAIKSTVFKRRSPFSKSIALTASAPLCRGGKTVAAPPPKAHKPAVSVSFAEVVEGSVTTMLKICAYIMLFSVISAYLPNWKCRPFIHSALEITGGIAELAESNVAPDLLLPLISFFTAFSGISVVFQVYSVISPCGLSVLPYVFGKLLQGIFSFAITYVFVMRFSETTDVFSPLPAEFGEVCTSPVSIFLMAVLAAVSCCLVLISAAHTVKLFESRKVRSETVVFKNRQKGRFL